MSSSSDIISMGASSLRTSITSSSELLSMETSDILLITNPESFLCVPKITNKN